MPEIKRQPELDILRLLAILTVIAIHSAGGLTIHTATFPISVHVMIVWCVPVLFMISGRFFLDPCRDVSLKKLLTKYVPRIVIAFLFWSIVYTVYYVVSGTYDGLNIFGILSQFLEGPYHFWYLFVLIGLYLLTPFLRKIAEDDQLLGYFLILFALLNITFEYLVYLPKIGPVIQSFAQRFPLDMATGYAGYYMLGYFLWHTKDRMSKKLETGIYLLGIVTLVGTVIAEGLISHDIWGEDFVKQYMKPNVIAYSSALYLLFVKRVSTIHLSEKTIRCFAFLTEMSFGVYCIHALINELFPFFGSLPILRTLSIYLISLALTWLIRKIPVVGKKIT